MVNVSSLVSHIEAFVDTSRPPDQQKASIDAVAGLVKNDLIPLEALVREMELYLTTTDDAIRARGILFLAEILTHLSNKLLGSSTISSLVGFFSSRLADWRALRGALIGCFALLKRKNNVGMVVDSDVRALAQSMLDNVQVQLLAMHDRKLCFEVFQCLLDVYSDLLATLVGDEFVYGLIQAVDQEKDPRCLVLTFRLVQSLVKLFPLQLDSGHVAYDLFEILSCYFPIYFTHKVGDDFEVKREDLSDALMNAFCSTPFFEPFAIPLLLDKLSSSLPLAKIDSLKYLNQCILSYGADRMVQHAKSIWSALKDVIFSFPMQLETSSSSSSATVLGGDMNSHEHEIAREALICLKTAIKQLTCPNNDDFLTLIIDDNDVDRSFCAVTMERFYSDNSDKINLQFSSLGSILSVVANASTFCCSRVFQKFFPRLIGILGISSTNLENGPDANSDLVSQNLNYGALFLCVQLLTSSRDLATTALESSIPMESLRDSWWHFIQDFSGPLTSAFKSLLVIPSMIIAESGNSNQEHVFYAVKGLQVLATFPGQYSPVSGESFEDILAAFMSVITDRSEKTFLWKLSLKSLAQIGYSVARSKYPLMQVVYNEIVVRRLVLLLHKDSTLSLALTLEAISEVGTCAPDFVVQVIQGLEEAILSEFLQVDGSSKATKTLVLLLDCYSNKVLPWCLNSQSIEGPGMHFAVTFLEQMENIIAFKVEPEMQDLLNRMMKTMKLVVRGCAVDNQHILLEKAYNIMLATVIPLVESVPFSSSTLERLHFIPDPSEITCKNKWLLYLFASIVIALHQQTPLPDVEKLVNLLLLFALKGHLPASQALASLVNKLPSDVDKIGFSNANILHKTTDMILETMSSILKDRSQKTPNMLNSDEVDVMQFCPNLQIHAVVGLAWLGKALLMRGHVRAKDTSLVLLKCLLSSQKIIPSVSHHGGEDMQFPVARSAADAFHILLSDSEACLNKNFYAVIRPLYKQRFFSSMMPILSTSIKECKSSKTRSLLYRAFGHTISGIPLVVLLSEENKVLPLLLDCLSMLDLDILNKDLIYSLLLVLSGFLMDEKGKQGIIGHVHIVINNLIKLISYPHMMLVRETSIQCLAAITSLPYARIYPLRRQVLEALSGALDDKKRIVREEAVKCCHVWASMASSSFLR